MLCQSIGNSFLPFTFYNLLCLNLLLKACYSGKDPKWWEKQIMLCSLCHRVHVHLWSFQLNRLLGTQCGQSMEGWRPRQCGFSYVLDSPSIHVLWEEQGHGFVFLSGFHGDRQHHRHSFCGYWELECPFGLGGEALPAEAEPCVLVVGCDQQWELVCSSEPAPNCPRAGRQREVGSAQQGRAAVPLMTPELLHPVICL